MVNDWIVFCPNSIRWRNPFHIRSRCNEWSRTHTFWCNNYLKTRLNDFLSRYIFEGLRRMACDARRTLWGRDSVTSFSFYFSPERHNTKELEKWRRALTHASQARNNPGTAQGGAGGMREISSVLMAIKFYSTASSSICARLNEGILPSNATEDPWCYKLITFDWTL